MSNETFVTTYARVRLVPAAALLLVTTSGCGTHHDKASTWGSEANAEELSAAAAKSDNAPVPREYSDDLTDEQIINWGRMGYTCGTGPATSTPSPEEIMVRLRPAERAPRIFEVLMRAPMSSLEAAGLVQLVASTQDPKAVSYVVRVFDASGEIAARGNRDGLGSGGFVQNESDRIRAGAATAAGVITDSKALGLLLRAIYDTSPTVRQQAVIALAKRPDFNDPNLLMEVRNTLHPAMQGAVDEVL